MAGLSACSFSFLLLGAIAIAEVYAVEVSQPIPVNVQGPARDAVPILLQAQDYQGPYDPLDPQGVAASQHRAAVVGGKNTLDAAASYIPPGAVEMLAKDLKNVLIREGKRFAIAHPLETAELAGIATKLMALIKTASHKVKVEGKKEQIKNHLH